MAVEGAGDLPAGSRGLYGVCLAGVQSHRKAASDRHRGFAAAAGFAAAVVVILLLAQTPTPI